jgi:hypothetical protein
MSDSGSIRCTAFDGERRLASGALADVAVAVKHAVGEAPSHDILVFEDATGRVVDLDLRGSPEEVGARHRLREAATVSATGPARGGRRGPGRPRLGVVSREVTLLPRHWAWLAAQRGGSSAALRRLVDQARRMNEARDQVRAAQDAAYRFMSAVAGDRAGFEEAVRALFRGERDRFEAEVRGWPADLRAHALRLAAPALGAILDEEG